MRKKNFISYCDTVFWYLIYFLPLIFFLCYLFVLKADFSTTFSSFMTDYCPLSNPIFQLLNSVLGIFSYSDNGTTSTLTLFGNNSGIVLYLAYCATVSLSHVFFDVIVFIPRLAHKWLGKSTQQD